MASRPRAQPGARRSRVPPLVLFAATTLPLAFGCSEPVAEYVTPEPISPPCGKLPSGVAHAVSGTLDTAATPAQRRVVLMGGSVEVDVAARAFVEGALGGDVVTLRSSGSTTSYNGYFHSGLDAEPPPGSAATLRFDEAHRSSHAAVLCRVDAAEAIWLAGGNQWNYLGRWPTELHAGIGEASIRGVAIGGTSAGAMALGEAAFDARSGGITSETALTEPLSSAVSVSASALAQPELAGWLVDSHFAERDRQGRLLVFLARMRQDLERDIVFGIGLDERAAVVIEDSVFTVHAEAGRGVWLYRVSGPAVLESDRPLSLDGIERVRLEDGDTDVWPPSFAGPVDSLRVVDGVIAPN